MTNKYQEEPEGYTLSTVAAEAARCLLCHDAPCSKACPAHVDPARFIRSVRFRNFKGAAETIRENNALGAVCARVCPTERYCESACTRAKIDRPIDIGGIQRFVTDFEAADKMEILHKGKPNGKKVAIIGAGPSGLQAAVTLLEQGFAVDVYDAHDKAGGYLSYGIPEYRLPQEIVDIEVNRIKKLGANFKLGTKVGQDVAFDDLKANYDAVLVAIGFSAAKTLPMFDHNIVAESAIAFLKEVRETHGEHMNLPDDVLVIGGGDVAMDASTTLKKLGVAHVTDVAYEEFKEFLASKKELAGTRKAGVTLIDGYVPTAVDRNKVTFKHRFADNELTITADKIILAIGQKLDASGIDIDVQHNEVPIYGHQYRTKDNKVFVTGDITPGDQTVVWAVQKGKEAANAIAQELGGQKDD